MTASDQADQTPGCPGRSGLAGRAAARLAAIQALYQMQMTGEDAPSVIADFLGPHSAPAGRSPEGVDLERADRDFFADLVAGIARESESLEDMVSAVIDEDWPVERLESLLRLILLAGAFELGHRPEVPARVVVSQYVDLAHAFLDDRQTALANGVLDSLARHLRLEEFAGEAVPDLTG